MRRQILSLLIDLGLILIATLSAIAIRDNFDVTIEKLVLLLPYIGWTLLSSALVVSVMGLPRAIWRFTSMSHYSQVVLAIVLRITQRGVWTFFCGEIRRRCFSR